MKRVLGLLIVLILSTGVVFAGGGRESQPESGVRRITVATDATWPPMQFVDENRQIVGFDIDLITAAAEAAGFEVVIQNTAWDGIFAGLANNDYDAVISSVTITEERRGTMDFSIPYINAGQVLIVRQDAPANWTSLEDLVGESVGAQIGTTGSFEVERIEGVTLRTYDELGMAIEDLAQGRIAGVVADTPIAADFALQNENYRAVLQIVGEPFTEEFYGVAVRRGNQEVLDLINAGLEVVLNDGTAEQLERRWLR